MSFFNKILASIGVGAAAVDTKLERDTLIPGEEARGIVEIRGGNTSQQVNAIHLSLFTTYSKESDDKKYTATGLIDQFLLTEPFTIQPNSSKQIPFSFRLPVDTPVSAGKTKIWVTTGLDIKNAMDPNDKDYIMVQPTPLMESVLKAVSDLGFRLREADCEEAPYRLRRRLPYMQEFEFVPVAGPFRGRLDELELVFFPVSVHETEIKMQVDRRARGLGGFLAEAFEADESNVLLTVTTSDIPNLHSKLQSVIERYT